MVINGSSLQADTQTHDMSVALVCGLSVHNAESAFIDVGVIGIIVIIPCQLYSHRRGIECSLMSVCLYFYLPVLQNGLSYRHQTG